MQVACRPCGVWPSQPGIMPSRGGGHKWSGRQDSNLRSPAPKAGALATTLRPGSTPLDERRRTESRAGPPAALTAKS
ncbi:protein of unknown function [Micropruina glycogenica]|uniref:Uncharacterized protein n=1 Tax=Micropruina glycogenica TaxID=75385 RepID=A0A2N9JDJ9_9ACTN|nr:protein of unknown function [Micropruina glycogenica]